MVAITIKLKPYQKIHDNHIWTKVVWAADCDGYPDDELLECHQCAGLYAECGCPGPTQDNVEYIEIDGFMYGREVEDDGEDTETESDEW